MGNRSEDSKIAWISFMENKNISKITNPENQAETNARIIALWFKVVDSII
jgi:hypothetical protein